MPFPRASRALERFTVLDLTRVRSGPDLRAPARRLGRQCHQDRAAAGHRRAGDPSAARAIGSDFQNLHRNKRSITLNLKAPEGVAAFKRLVEEGRCAWSRISVPT